MELQQLRCFFTVAKLEHFSKAAEELNISQSALSLTIQKLSSELGVPLFEKSGRNVRLTSYGRAFLSKAEPAYHQLLEAAAYVSAKKAKDSKKIVVYGPSMFSYRNLMKQINLFCPEIGLKNVAVPAETALANIRDGQGDIAILMLPPCSAPDGELFEYVLFPRYDLVAIMNDRCPLAEEQAVTPEQLSSKPFVAYSEGINIRPVLDDYFPERAVFWILNMRTTLSSTRSGWCAPAVRSR